MKKYLLVLATIMFASPLFGQEAKLGNWYVYLGNKTFKEKWNWQSSVQYRSYNAISDLNQLLIRNGIGYNLSEKNNNISLGYDFVLSKKYDALGEKSISTEEHRLYQQFTTKQSASRFFWQHRYRFEERFIAKDFKFRFRYALFLKVPLNNKKVVNKTFYVAAYNEIFLNSTGNKFDQNWLYGGIGYKHNKFLTFEIGYLNQFLSASNRDQLNLILKSSF